MLPLVPKHQLESSLPCSQEFFLTANNFRVKEQAPDATEKILYVINSQLKTNYKEYDLLEL
jgi:hypothetical protein